MEGEIQIAEGCRSVCEEAHTCEWLLAEARRGGGVPYARKISGLRWAIKRKQKRGRKKGNCT